MSEFASRQYDNDEVNRIIRRALKLKNELRGRKIEVIGIIPNDPIVFEAGLEGHTLDRGEAYQAAGNILEYLL